MKTVYDEEVTTKKVVELDGIKFQNGTEKDNGVNGYQIEDLISIALIRLEALNSKVPCAENEDTINHLKRAKEAQERRTENRIKDGKEKDMKLEIEYSSYKNEFYAIKKQLINTQDKRM